MNIYTISHIATGQKFTVEARTVSQALSIHLKDMKIKMVLQGVGLDMAETLLGTYYTQLVIKTEPDGTLEDAFGAVVKSLGVPGC